MVDAGRVRNRRNVAWSRRGSRRERPRRPRREVGNARIEPEACGDIPNSRLSPDVSRPSASACEPPGLRTPRGQVGLLRRILDSEIVRRTTCPTDSPVAVGLAVPTFDPLRYPCAPRRRCPSDARANAGWPDTPERRPHGYGVVVATPATPGGHRCQESDLFKRAQGTDRQGRSDQQGPPTHHRRRRSGALGEASPVPVRITRLGSSGTFAGAEALPDQPHFRPGALVRRTKGVRATMGRDASRGCSAHRRHHLASQ
jgi:hypothetical protein